jgi:hypothetical protein
LGRKPTERGGQKERVMRSEYNGSTSCACMKIKVMKPIKIVKETGGSEI